MLATRFYLFHLDKLDVFCQTIALRLSIHVPTNKVLATRSRLKRIELQNNHWKHRLGSGPVNSNFTKMVTIPNVAGQAQSYLGLRDTLDKITLD